MIPTDKDGKVAGALPAGSIKAVPQLATVSYLGGVTKDATSGIETFNYHNSAKSVVSMHKPGYMMIQACIAILILVGFESVTAMGEEAKNAKRDIPKAVILSLVIQGGFCYLFEYFAANYYLNSGYTASTAGGSSAPIGDIMQLVGAWAFGSANAGWWFMMIEACTVFLALIGTTLSCVNTGARVTYAMGRDEEMGAHFGLLHGKNATPHRCIWTLAVNFWSSASSRSCSLVLRASRTALDSSRRRSLPTTASGTKSACSTMHWPPRSHRAFWLSRSSATSALSCST